MCGGDGPCSETFSQTSPYFSDFNSYVYSLQKSCMSKLSELDENSAELEKEIKAIYNNCTETFLNKVTAFAEEIGSVLGVSSDEVGDVILSQGTSENESLSCIADKLSKIYPLVSSYIEMFNEKVNKLLKINWNKTAVIFFNSFSICKELMSLTISKFFADIVYILKLR